MSEPTQVTAGLNWAWSATFPGFDSGDGWSIKYYFWPADGAGAGFDLDAVAGEGASYSVAQSPNDTKNRPPGRYDWQAIASRNAGAEKSAAAKGAMQILPDPTGAPVDGRSHAEIVLAAIEAVIERRATSSQKSIEVEGQRLEHMSHADLIMLRNNYATEVDRERQAAALTAGAGFGKKILTRF